MENVIKTPQKDFSEDYMLMYPESLEKVQKYKDQNNGRLAMAVKSVTVVVTEDCNLRCSYCVSGDTEIKLDDYSTKPIKDISVGDKVLAFNEYVPGNGTHRKLEVATVTKTFRRESESLLLTLEDGRALKVTEEHPILISESNPGNVLDYCPAGKVTPGQTVFALSEGERRVLQEVRVASVERLPGEIPVFNIETTAGTYIACSFAVHNCYQHDKNKNHRLTSETARRIVDTLFEEDSKNNCYLNPDIAQAIILDFIGGEPLLNIDIISYFMRYFKWKAVQLNHRWAIHYMISISSNGTLYNNPAVQKFLAIHRGRVSLGITLDGNKTLHDTCRLFPDGTPSYDIVASAVLSCQRDFDQSRLTKLTLAPANIIHLFEAVKNLYEVFDFYGVHANCVYENGWDNEHAVIMYEQMKMLADWMIDHKIYETFYCSLFDDFIGHPLDEKENHNYCGGTGSMLAFTTEGYITPCLRYTRFNLNDAQPEIRVGDITTGIANTTEYRAIIDDLDGITRRSQSTDECFNCPIASGCGWCSAYNYEIYGTPNKRCTAICPTHKARVLANVYYWNKLYRKLGLTKRFACNVPEAWAIDIISKDEFDSLKALAEP